MLVTSVLLFPVVFLIVFFKHRQITSVQCTLGSGLSALFCSSIHLSQSSLPAPVTIETEHVSVITFDVLYKTSDIVGKPYERFVGVPER